MLVWCVPIYIWCVGALDAVEFVTSGFGSESFKISGMFVCWEKNLLWDVRFMVVLVWCVPIYIWCFGALDALVIVLCGL